MCLAQGSQRGDAGEARPRGPSVSSQALYHCATALPQSIDVDKDSANKYRPVAPQDTSDWVFKEDFAHMR